MGRFALEDRPTILGVPKILVEERSEVGMVAMVATAATEVAVAVVVQILVVVELQGIFSVNTVECTTTISPSIVRSKQRIGEEILKHA